MVEQIIQSLYDNIEELEGEVIEADTKLIVGGYINSFDIINLLGALEREFDIDIPLDNLNLDDFATPRSISAFMSKLTSA